MTDDAEQTIFDPRAGAGRPPGSVPYHYERDLIIAIRAALAAERPLLLRGNPGSGKSTLARDVAWCLGRRYLGEVITSRTQAHDLQWRFDAVRRLADIQADPKRRLGGAYDAPYIEPGVLWRAFDLADAREHGVGARPRAAQSTEARDAVVLLDEIDKADPDVPNDLLDVLEKQTFRVSETNHVVARVEGAQVFLVLTTNRERELPGAFLRRCVVFDLADPGEDVLKTIGRLHHPDPERPGAVLPAAEALLDPVWKALKDLRKQADTARLRAPTTAEFLDALRACLKMRIAGTDDPSWSRVMQATMWKHGALEKKA